jgi:serine/threonine-protein kinase
MTLDNLSGQTLGQYELREMLGQGGMGAVYRGFQTSLTREVAVKVLTPDLTVDPSYLERFTREARTAAALEHAHIVPVYDYGTQGAVSYIVMRLLTGGSLSERILAVQDGRLKLPTLREASNVLYQIAQALDYAHQRGVIHRDIKANNVMFDHQGSPFLVDFGIAKLTGATNALTGTGVAMGTPSYMAPEQWRGGDITPAADQYALAVLAYVMATGKLPFDGATPYELMYKHLNEEPTPPQIHRESLPDDLRFVLAKGLAKTPDDRYDSVITFADAFKRIGAMEVDRTTGFFSSPLAGETGARSVPVSSAPAVTPPPPVPVGSSQPRAINGPTTPPPARPPTQPSASAAGSASAPQSIAGRGGGSMMMWGALVAVLLVIGAVIAVIALSGGDDDGAAAASAATHTETATATPETPTATSSATATDTLTLTPTLIPTTTPATPFAQLPRNLDVRAGPGSRYPVLGRLGAGEQVAITGISEDGSWYEVRLSDGTIGWLTSSTAIVDAYGDLRSLPIAATPTSTATDTATATFTPTITDTPTATATLTPSATATDTPTFTATVTPSATHTPTATATIRPTTTATFTLTARPTSTATATRLPTATPAPTLATCPGALASRIGPGMQARVSASDPRPVNVRSGPGTDFPRVGQAAVLTTLTVLEGPTCADGYAWFLVEYSAGQTGWVAEGDDFYFIEPLPGQTNTGTNTNTGSGDLLATISAPVAGDRVLATTCTVLFEDEFAGDDSPYLWFLDETDRYSIQFAQDSYLLQVNYLPDGTDPQGEDAPALWGSLRGVDVDDGRIEAVMSADRFNDTRHRMGLWVRYVDEEHFLAIMIRGDGAYRISVYNDDAGGYSDLVSWTYTDAMNTGDNAVNTVRIDINGNMIDLTINGAFLTSVIESTLADGRIAFWGASSQTPVNFYLDFIRVCRN